MNALSGPSPLGENAVPCSTRGSSQQLLVKIIAVGYERLAPWPVVIALAGLAITTLSGLGSYKPFVYLIQFLVLMHAAGSLWSGVRPGRAVWLMLLAPAVFMLCDLLSPTGGLDRYAARNLLAFVAIAGAFWMLPRRWPARVGRSLYLAIVGGLTAIAVTHAVLLWLYLEPHGLMGNPRLLFGNPHFIALQATVVGLVMAHAWAQRGVARAIAALGVVAVVVNILLLESIIATLSIAAGAAVVACAYLPRRLRLVAGGVGGLVLLAVLTYPMIPEPYEIPLDWIMREAGASRPDERFKLWSDAWRLQQESGVVEWLVGHGFAGFSGNYREIWNFPHHFPLEVLYNSGLLGLLAFMLAAGALAEGVVRSLAPGRPTALLATALLVAVGLFTFLTLPLTSRVGAHALGLSIGFWLWAARRDSFDEHEPWPARGSR